MHHGFRFNYAIPADANQHRFGKYADYGGTITTPDGITIVMVHHEHTWRLPTFALPDKSSKEPLSGLADLVKLAYQGVRPEQRSTQTLVEFRRLLETEYNVSKLTLMQHR